MLNAQILATESWPNRKSNSAISRYLGRKSFQAVDTDRDYLNQTQRNISWLLVFIGHKHAVLGWSLLYNAPYRIQLYGSGAQHCRSTIHTKAQQSPVIFFPSKMLDHSWLQSASKKRGILSTEESPGHCFQSLPSTARTFLEKTQGEAAPGPASSTQTVPSLLSAQQHHRDTGGKKECLLFAAVHKEDRRRKGCRVCWLAALGESWRMKTPPSPETKLAYLQEH